MKPLFFLIFVLSTFYTFAGEHTYESLSKNYEESRVPAENELAVLVGKYEANCVNPEEDEFKMKTILGYFEYADLKKVDLIGFRLGTSKGYVPMMYMQNELYSEAYFMSDEMWRKQQCLFKSNLSNCRGLKWGKVRFKIRGLALIFNSQEYLMYTNDADKFDGFGGRVAIRAPHGWRIRLTNNGKIVSNHHWKGEKRTYCIWSRKLEDCSLVPEKHQGPRACQ